MQVTILVIIKTLGKGHHRCDHQAIAKMASSRDHQMQNITNVRNASSSEQNCAIMKGKIVQNMNSVPCEHVSV